MPAISERRFPDSTRLAVRSKYARTCSSRGPHYPETRSLPFEFVEQNLDTILAKLPREVAEDFAAALPSLGGNFCDAGGRAQVDEFFRDRVKEYTGGPRRLAQALESIDLCSARSGAIRPGVAEFLRSH